MSMRDLFAGICLGILLTLAIQWAQRRSRRRKPDPSKILEFPAPPPPQLSVASDGFLDSIMAEEDEDEVVARLRRNLRVKVFHDDAKLERLIENERRRTPGASMRILLEAAIERWERDNR
jgi:hypothetical protein